MKRITIKKLELKNFKNHSSLTVDFPSSGLGSIVVSGHNGSGKSSIIQGVLWVLGATMPAEQILNSTTLAPASVEMVLSVDGEDIKLSRVLVPQKNEAGKVVASTSNYVINDRPEKATLYASKVAEIFGTRDWQYLLNPSLVPFLKDARNILLAVAGAPSESEFMKQHNPALAQVIGTTSFSDFEAREKQAVQALGKKIDAIPGRIEENAAMLQEIPEMEDEAPIHQRIAEIREVLKGVDQTNAERADQYNKVACEAQSLRNEGQKLRNMAAQKVAEANKEANKQIEEAEKICFEWRQTLNGFLREQDRIKAEMSEARQDQATKEKQLADVNAEIQTLADRCKTVAGWKPKADGMCKQCNKFCPELQALGLTAAIEYQQKELDNTKSKGRATVAQRDKLQADLEAIAKKIDGLMSQEHSNEAKITALSPEPKAPERTVITETPESLHLIGQAQDLETTAEKLIKSNKLDIAQKPTELVEELQQLNEKLTRRGIATTTQKNNDKITARIEELREEESALITTQLQHKQHIAQLKEFYKQYADSVTASVNKLFEGTGYEIRLFDTNMGNDKGVPVMQPMKEGSTNLSTAENLIFNLRYIERVLMKHYKVQCPVLADNAECVSDWGKLVGKHQSIIASVDHRKLTIWPFSVSEAQSQSK